MEIKVGYLQDTYNACYLSMNRVFFNSEQIKLIESRAKEWVKELGSQAESPAAVRLLEVRLIQQLYENGGLVPEVLSKNADFPKQLDDAKKIVGRKLAIEEALASTADRKLNALSTREVVSCQHNLVDSLEQFLEKYPSLRQGLETLSKEIQKDVEKSLSIYAFADLLLYTYNPKIMEILAKGMGKQVEEIGADELTMAKDILLTFQTNTRFANAIREMQEFIMDLLGGSAGEGVMSELTVTLLQYPVGLY